MIRFLLGLLFALLAERACEKLRPTKRYAYGGWMKINDGQWQFRQSRVVLRRPWEVAPVVKAKVSTVDMGWMGTVSFQGPMVYPVRSNAA